MEKNKNRKLRIPIRSTYNFTTEEEKRWLELTDEQERKIDSLLKSKYEQNIKSASNDGKKKLSFSFKFNNGSVQQNGAKKPNLDELYDSLSSVLLPSQMDELKTLDRWRLLGIRPFNYFLNAEEIEFDEIQFDADYESILDDSVEKLRQISAKQREQVTAILPDDWKQKLKRQ